jgi:hypothetical protein
MISKQILACQGDFADGLTARSEGGDIGGRIKYAPATEKTRMTTTIQASDLSESIAAALQFIS